MNGKCHPNPCKHQGTCSLSVDEKSFSCKCNSGDDWRGELCNEWDSCVSEPCAHGGTCTRQGYGTLKDRGSFTCECKNGWGGKDCREDQLCASQPCQHGGICSHYNTPHYSCACGSTGFGGQNCEEDPCDGKKFAPCQNGGTCERERGGTGVSRTCSCPKEYKGLTCGTDICQSTPCKNQGTCVPDSGTFTCTCRQGWGGGHCQTDKWCSSRPCKNGGSCVHECAELPS